MLKVSFLGIGDSAMKKERLTIHQLRREAFTAWETLLFCKGAYTGAAYVHEVDDDAVTERYPWTNEQFTDEVRQRFGDLRRRSTWEQAAISLEAQVMALVDGSLEPIEILEYMAIEDASNGPIREHYKDAVLEQMLMYPELLELIKEVLEDLYRSDSAEERFLVGQFMESVGPKMAQLPAAPKLIGK